MFFYRMIWGRYARITYAVLILGVTALSTGLRLRTYLETRKIQAVLSGMARVRVDVTREEEVLKIVPHLIQDPNSPNYYLAEVKNFSGDLWTVWIPSLLQHLWPNEIGAESLLVKDKWRVMGLPTRIAYVLGWRHLRFFASITVSNGTVSQMGYSLQPDLFIAWPADEFVSARTVHGYLRARGQPIRVGSIGEEVPDFRFGAIASQFSWFAGADSALAVAYTPAAPADMVAHVFEADLTCFWGFKGCDSVRQVVPSLWRDRERLAARTEQRFASADPCPDEVLAGRVRTLPDLSVALLEVVHSREMAVNHEGDQTPEFATDYQVKETIWGKPKGPWTDIRYRWEIPSSSSPTGSVPNPIRPSLPKAGERFLYFSGARFDSCRIVPATPSAESAVRRAVPARGRAADYLIEGRM